MRAPTAKVIEGRRYEVVPLPAGQGLNVLTRLGKLLGPAVGKAASLAEAAEEVTAAIGTIAERLDPDEIDAIARTLATTTTMETEPGSGTMRPLKDVFDLHFAGNYVEMFGWLRFALEANFGPLFKGLGRTVNARVGSNVAVA